ncbi:MAG: sugar transferase [Candidatus Berkelbacteria bacterium Licking1014_85]|uniref:Sugar transferase n=1 Tax=Candidatus Berkelbacteria bacterium Licking1014_85 TaxID=2017148 RepID=A0A554LJW7_9BACT|nr:MAG: sugar transferase [Candidatus Berkelbacteria bacterium Licking1014_85]
MYWIISRIINFSLAFVLIIILLPLLIIIALFIKFDSKGPIIYTQIRVGKDGKKFMFYKFRTMRENAEHNKPLLAVANDKRRTRAGIFLRNAYFDELPQLWNILKGEMSFVGPRPERPYFHNKFKKEMPDWPKRLAILPGITGWAQIHTATSHNPKRKLKLDLEYIQRKSFLFDLGIAIISLVYILSGISYKIYMKRQLTHIIHGHPELVSGSMDSVSGFHPVRNDKRLSRVNTKK